MKNDWKLVILESPFAGDIEANLTFARACVRDCVLRGESAQASHLLFTQPGILRDDIPDERALGIAAGLAWKRAADYSVFYTDRGWSSGMLAALHVLIGAWWKLKIRALNGEPKLPTTLDDHVENFLREHIDRSKCP